MSETNSDSGLVLKLRCWWHKLICLTHQSTFVKAIEAALDYDESLYAFPWDAGYQYWDVKAYNRNIKITPAAVTYPRQLHRSRPFSDVPPLQA